MLEEFEPPVDFVVVRGDYKGIDVEEVWTADLKEHDTGEVSGGSSNASDGSSEHLERLSIGPD